MLNDYRRETDDPALDQGVRSLLAAASAPSEPGPQPGEVEALTAFRAHHSDSRRSPVLSSRPLKATLAAALGAGALLLGGAGAAAAGALPGAAQDIASTMLSTVGVEVPDANEASAGHADERGTSDDTEDSAVETEQTSETGTTETDATEGEGAEGKGAEISEMATSDDTSGLEKGMAVSDAASDDKSQAGEHGGEGEHAKDPDETDDASEVTKKSAKADASSDDASSDDAKDAAEVEKSEAEDDVTEAEEDAGDAAETGGESGDGHSGAGTEHRP